MPCLRPWPSLRIPLLQVRRDALSEEVEDSLNGLLTGVTFQEARHLSSKSHCAIRRCEKKHGCRGAQQDRSGTLDGNNG